MPVKEQSGKSGVAVCMNLEKDKVEEMEEIRREVRVIEQGAKE